MSDSVPFPRLRVAAEIPGSVSRPLGTPCAVPETSTRPLGPANATKDVGRRRQKELLQGFAAVGAASCCSLAVVAHAVIQRTRKKKHLSRSHETVRIGPAEPQVVSQVKATKAKARNNSERIQDTPAVGGGLVHLQLLSVFSLPPLCRVRCTCHSRHRKACDVRKRRWDLGRHRGAGGYF